VIVVVAPMGLGGISRMALPSVTCVTADVCSGGPPSGGHLVEVSDEM
jgi:hypothetical protein